MVTAFDLNVEIGNTKEKLYWAWTQLTQTVNGQQHAAPAWAMAEDITTQYEAIELACTWARALPEPSDYDDTLTSVKAAKSRMEEDEFASAPETISSSTGGWTGTAALNFRNRFIDQFDTATVNQMAMVDTVAHAYAGVQGLVSMSLAAGVETCKAAQKAYQDLVTGGGGINTGAWKMALSIANVLTGIGAAAAAIATGGATLAFYLGTSAAVTGFLSGLLEEEKSKPPELSGSDPIDVTGKFTAKMSELQSAHSARTDKLRRHINGDIGLLERERESKLLPERPTIAS